MGCERESELLMALRAGNVSEELRTHVKGCTYCQTTERAASPLLLFAGTVTAQVEPPSAAGVWRRAQQRRQEAALRGAARGMLAMRALGVMYVMGVVGWALRVMWQTQPEQGRRVMVALTSGTVPLGVGAALVLLVVGVSSLMFFGQRQQGTLVR